MKRWMIAAVLAAPGLAARAEDPPAKEEPMPAVADAKREPPPIDRELPAKLETATFALG
jgi:hypothetical protein